MVFPSADGTFGCVCAMDVRWCILEFCIVFSDEGLNILGGFIVEAVELGSVAAGLKELVDFFISFQEFAAVSGFDGVRFYVVRIDGIEDDYVVVSSIRCDGEAAGLVGEQLSFNVHHCHED